MLLRFLAPSALILLIAVLATRPTVQMLYGLERRLDRLGRRPARALALVGLIAFGLNALATGISGEPYPRVEDEFVCLLGAQTFAKFRLAYPQHPVWPSLEAALVITHPTYSSKFPPGQSILLAIGLLVSRHAIVGAWLGCSLAAMAVYWMLLVWMPARWALLGGLMAATHPVTLEWGQCYWGGSVALMGGALTLGALRRLMRTWQKRDALLLGLGTALLLNSRPYEALGVLLPAAILLFRAFRAARRPFEAREAMSALLGSLFAIAVCMAFYNYQVTGDPLLLPAVHWQRNPGSFSQPPPFFAWADAEERPVGFWQVAGEKLAYFGVTSFRVGVNSLYGPPTEESIHRLGLFTDWLRYTMLLPLLALPMALRRTRALRLPLAMVGLTLGLLLLSTHARIQYLAPALAPGYLVLLQSLRALRAWRPRRRRIGAAAALLTLCVWISGVGAWFQQQWWYRLGVNPARPIRTQAHWPEHREKARRFLEQQPGRHLVMLKTAPDYQDNLHWCYNDADIDNARIVWAQTAGPHEDDMLFRYFSERQFWIFLVDQEYHQPVRLLPQRAEKPASLRSPERRHRALD